MTRVSMRSFEQLEEAWRSLPPAPRGLGRVRLIVLRRGNEVHEVTDRAELSPQDGVRGDRWALSVLPREECQVTLMSARVAELIADGARPLHLAGDNFLVDLDLGEEALPVGSRLRLGGAVVEVTATPHLGCQKFAARFGQEALRWVNWKPHRGRRLRGVNCRVVEAGTAAVGDAVALLGAAA
jgi:MOSC domain-containing protein YiiM